jgi:uncharacterized protein (DUF1697 family)
VTATRQIALLRGINLGPSRRVPMAELRERLGAAGYEDVATYVQSGNIVLTSTVAPTRLADTLHDELQEWFGLDIPVVVRTAEQLAAVIEANPLADVADEPKRYQVSFLDRALPKRRAEQLAELAAGDERVVVRGREIFAWHPRGVARSKLWNELAGSKLGVVATARNWRTVLELDRLARG